MKCNSKSTRAKKEELARERAQKEREDMLSAMSEEEREAFLANEKIEHQESCRRAEQVLLGMAAISSYTGINYSKFLK